MLADVVEGVKPQARKGDEGPLMDENDAWQEDKDQERKEADRKME